MQSINYNPMLMMLWNLQPNIMCVGDFQMWDKSEDELIQKAKEINSDQSLKLAFMNMATIQEFDQGILTDGAVKLKGIANDMDIFANYILGRIKYSQESIFEQIKSLLNVQKIIVKKDFSIYGKILEIEALNKVFGKENVYVIDDNQDTNNIQKLKESLNKGDVRKYREVTGINYSYRGIVVDGNHQGRELGYPTANVVTPFELPLKEGVYFSKVKLPNDNKLHDAMSCYWNNSKTGKTIETYIFDFNQDIYGWNIKIYFNEWLRDLKPASSKQALITMLEKDELDIRNKFIGEQ